MMLSNKFLFHLSHSRGLPSDQLIHENAIHSFHKVSPDLNAQIALKLIDKIVIKLPYEELENPNPHPPFLVKDGNRTHYAKNYFA